MADDVAAVLPPQATGASLPGQAADFADIAPAPSAEDTLLAANFGDKGAQQYKDLRTAGQRAPTPAAAPLTALAGMPAPAAPASQPGGIEGMLGGGTGAANASPIFRMLAGPEGMAGTQNAELKARAAIQQRKQQAQTMAIADGTFLHNLKDQPINMRAAMIQAYAARQGRELLPAEATYIANVDPDTLAHTIERAKAGDVLALEQMSSLFSGDPMKMVNANTEMRKTNAEADRAVADATTAQANAPFAARQAEAKTVHAEQVNQTFHDTAERRATAEAATQGLKPGTPEYSQFVQSRVDKASEDHARMVGEMKARLEAVKPTKLTSATRTMHESAPTLVKLLDRVEGDLNAIEAGPLASRFQDFLSGKIGTPNPEFVRYKNRADLASTLLMRMHVGARGTEGMLEHFKKMLNAGIQSPENMHANLEVIRDYANDIMAQDKAMEGAAPGAGGGGTYADPSALKAAVAAGTLDRAAGAKIAKEKGWIQ